MLVSTLADSGGTILMRIYAKVSRIKKILLQFWWRLIGLTLENISYLFKSRRALDKETFRAIFRLLRKLRNELPALLLFILLSLVLNVTLVLGTGDRRVIVLPEATPLYFKVFGEFTWDHILSQPSHGLDYLYYRYAISIVNNFLNFSVTHLVVAERIWIQFSSFFGAYLLGKYYLVRYARNGTHTLAPIIAALVYGLSPSFIIADSFWLNIEFAFCSLPWILLSFTKTLVERKWTYGVITALFMAINIDEHFLWAGFPVLLLIYSLFFFGFESYNSHRPRLGILKAPVLTMVTFLLLVAHRIAIRLATTSNLQFSSTKAAVDIPFYRASLSNMVRGMTNMSIPDIYQTSSPLLGSLNTLEPLTLGLTILGLSSIFFYRRTWVIFFCLTILFLSVLIFSNDSLLKPIHYYLFFGTPLGPAFRTWRIPDAYTSLSLTIMISFSLNYIFVKLRNVRALRHLDSMPFSKTDPRRKFASQVILGVVVSTIVFVFVIYGWPLLTGDVNGQLSPVTVPVAYSNVYKFLSSHAQNVRTVYFPDFTSSYGAGAPDKPSWSPKLGTLQEFLSYSSPTPTFYPIGWYSHFYDYTFSQHYPSLIGKDATTLSYFMNMAGIKYIVIHDDVPSLRDITRSTIERLYASQYFKPVFKEDFIIVFENLLYEEYPRAVPVPVLVDGGYRTLERYIENSGKLDHPTNFRFLDQTKQIDDDGATYRYIMTDKPDDQIAKDLIFSRVSDRYSTYFYDMVSEYEPSAKWSKGSFFDPHQSEWHPFIRNLPNYAWDFDYMRGIAFTSGSKDAIHVPLTVNQTGQYIVSIRYFANEFGGNMDLKVGNTRADIISKSKYDGFLWSEYDIFLEKGFNTLQIRNISGNNALSVAFIIPKTEYNEIKESVIKKLDNMKIVDVNFQNPSNGSFEQGINDWAPYKANDFKVSIENSVSIRGNHSLKVTTYSLEKDWSWIGSKWIDVTPENRYTFVSYMKGENVSESHIVLEGYDEDANKVIQLGQVPKGQSGSFDWKISKAEIIIPKNITKVRIMLNAGWPYFANSPASTWFDGIQFYSAETNHISVKSYQADNVQAKITSSSRPNETKSELSISASAPFFLVFDDAFDPGWRATSQGKISVSSPINSVTNGFFFVPKEDPRITIEYYPQTAFDYGVAVSVVTLTIMLLILAIKTARANLVDHAPSR